MSNDYDIQNLLGQLLSAKPHRTLEAPRDRRGLYGLIDHEGKVKYIGSTSSTQQTLYQRIHQRHRTGSEDMSHYFSRMYNTGRMYRDRHIAQFKADADIAKRLRNEFIADHCRAIWLPLPDNAPIAVLEASILSIAPKEVIAWNWHGTNPYSEPTALVDETISRLRLNTSELEAIKRQSTRYMAAKGKSALSETSKSGFVPLPEGPFDFVALDVETANVSRSSICQIGLAFVRDGKVTSTWSSYIDPKTDLWMYSNIHGITAATVRGAPSFSEVLAVLQDVLAQQILFQHSHFDSSAINAACLEFGHRLPHWEWRDSVKLARQAWPELKGNGGHGLASLKKHLDLSFDHHDAEEDARAAAEVVILAMSRTCHASNNIFQLEQSKPLAISMPTKLEKKTSSNPHVSALTRDAFKAIVVAKLDCIAIPHRVGHQSAYANRYFYYCPKGIPIELMFEKGVRSPPNLWVERTHFVDIDISQFDHKIKPLNEGRHSALKQMPQLANSEVICFRLRTIGELEKILSYLENC